jgi:hypothetical protein
MTTRKEVLVKKYTELQLAIKQENIDVPFPSLQEIDLVDLLFYFDMIFANSTDYKKSMKDSMEFSKGKLTDEQLDKVYPIIEPFIKWLLFEFPK